MQCDTVETGQNLIPDMETPGDSIWRAWQKKDLGTPTFIGDASQETNF